VQVSELVPTAVPFRSPYRGNGNYRERWAFPGYPDSEKTGSPGSRQSLLATLETSA
jgi:hypothetical protein